MQKYEVFQHLKDFKALVETQSRKNIKVLRADNRGEYVNHEIHNIYHEAEIQDATFSSLYSAKKWSC
jgi:hypothetical protein